MSGHIHTIPSDALEHNGNTEAVTHKLTVQARMVVNAAGPWAEHMLRDVMAVPTTTGKGGDANKKLRLVKGSHIVVPRLFQHDHAYIFQNPDKRIIFAIPYEGDFTLIGTTDLEILRQARDARGRPLQVVVLKTPSRVRPALETPEFAAGYVNFYVCNGAVIAPVFGDRTADEAAHSTLSNLFPGRQVVPVAIVSGFILSLLGPILILGFLAI